MEVGGVKLVEDAALLVDDEDVSVALAVALNRSVTGDGVFAAVALVSVVEGYLDAWGAGEACR